MPSTLDHIRVLYLGSSPDRAGAFRRRLEKFKAAVDESPGDEAGIRAIPSGEYALFVLDPGDDGFPDEARLIAAIEAEAAAVVLLADRASAEVIAAADIRIARDDLTTEDGGRLEFQLDRAVERRRFLAENARLRAETTTLAARLKVCEQRAEAAERTKRTFLTNLTHELRTPLNAIGGFTQLMRLDHRRGPEDQEKLAVIAQGCERLTNLLNDLLAIAKLETGKIELTRRAFDLHQLLSNVATMFEPRAQAQGIQFVGDMGPDIPQIVSTDEEKLRQILINLIGNAFKYTSRGTIAWRVSWRGGTCRFEVEDTGQGIGPEQLSRLFDMFANPSFGDDGEPGGGLGLALSRAYARLLGGDILVQSEPGKGSLFMMEIPMCVVAEVDRRQRKVKRVIGLEADQPAYRVLIVEEATTDHQPLAHLLSSVGFQVRSAASNLEAIAVAREWHPHFIWMDIPELVVNCFDATGWLRNGQAAGASAALPYPKIVALAAAPMESGPRALYDEVVAKPYRETTVFDVLKTQLGARFRYEENVSAATTPQNLINLHIPAGLAALPPLWVAALRQNVLEGDVFAARKIVAQIGGQDERLAAELHKLLDSYRFDDILSLLEQP